MNEDEYQLAIAQLLGSPSQGPAVRRPQAPSDPFLNDDFLFLLHCARDKQVDISNLRLHGISDSLSVYLSREKPKHLRARATVEIGRFVQRELTNVRTPSVINHSHPMQWFQRARQLGSVVGAWEYAELLLKGGNLSIRLNPKLELLPHVVMVGEAFKEEYVRFGVPSAVRKAWQDCARVTLRHVPRKFMGWDREDFDSALACIINYLVIPSSVWANNHGQHIDDAMRALRWFDLLWKRLIEHAPCVCAPQDAADSYRSFLVEQRLAVMAYLESLKDLAAGTLAVHDGGPQPDTEKDLSSPLHARSVGSTSSEPLARQVGLTKGNDTVVVITTAIPKSSDRGDQGVLDQYIDLRRAVPITQLPSSEHLQQIEQALVGEFPWALEAISAVMDELFARRRNGAIRLGLSPMLLVGPPGSGKTRFVQRLGDLLRTPSMIINLAGMADSKMLKGTARGWAGGSPSRILQFIQQTSVANPFFILDELDKLSDGGGNSGDPRAVLLDLLEPRNAARYQDSFVLAECDLSHCIYVATANSMKPMTAPMLSRLRPVFFPGPRQEDGAVLLRGVLRDLETSWNLPAGTLTLASDDPALLLGLSGREMRLAVIRELGRRSRGGGSIRH
jgi:hypothetical protein